LKFLTKITLEPLSKRLKNERRRQASFGMKSALSFRARKKMIESNADGSNAK